MTDSKFAIIKSINNINEFNELVKQGKCDRFEDRASFAFLNPNFGLAMDDLFFSDLEEFHEHQSCFKTCKK